MQDVVLKPNVLYPLKFKPLFKDYIWGGQNLSRLGKLLPGLKVAESWEISAHPDGMGIVANGPLEDRTLQELVEMYGESFLGSSSIAYYGPYFPLLLKLIDANDKLSVQVHPNDRYAKTHENDLGKTEMWLIMDAAPKASIIYGFKDGMTRDAFTQAVQKGKIGDCLQSVSVKKGDIIYIPAGTVHSIGTGILIAEIQQNSNATYRLYDYDRKNPDGTNRPLHIQKALDAIDFQNMKHRSHYTGLPLRTQEGLTIRPVVADPHFFTEVVKVSSKAVFLSDSRSFQTFLFTEGAADLCYTDGSISVQRGEAILIPANMGEFTLKGQVSALRSYIGDIESDILKPLKEAGYSMSEIHEHVAGLDQL